MTIVAFTSSGTFTVPAGVTQVDVLIVAGGGGGGRKSSGNFVGGGGGGAGGVRWEPMVTVTPEGTVAVTVGLGGAGGNPTGDNAKAGGDSSFGALTATGGGAGAISDALGSNMGQDGGSGGGGRYDQAGGSGAAGQGHRGGTACPTTPAQGAGGGGGAGGVGEDGQDSCGGSGGNGRDFSAIFGTSYGVSGWFGGGGGGGAYTANPAGDGGTGGGGAGGANNANGTSATASTGGGGGGAGGGTSGSASGGNGASGIVIIRYGENYQVVDTNNLKSGILSDTRVEDDRLKLAYQGTAFGEYTTAAQPSDWTAEWTTTNHTWRVREVSGAEGGKVLRGAFSGTTNSRRAISWDDKDAADVDVVCRVSSSHKNSSASLTGHHGVVVRGSGAGATEQGYAAVFAARSFSSTVPYETFRLTKYVSGTFSLLAEVSFFWSTNTYYWMRLQAIGTAIKAKIWAGEKEDEPSAWTIEATDSSIATGWAGALNLYANNNSYDYDSIELRDLHKSSGTRIKPHALSGTFPGATINWTATTPTDTTLAVHAQVQGETAITDEAVGTGDGAETEFTLDQWPVGTVTVKVDGTAETGFTQDLNDPRIITFTTAPADTLAVTTSYTGVDDPVALNWEAQTSGNALTVPTSGTNVANKHLWLKQTLATTDTDVTPTLTALDVTLSTGSTATLVFDGKIRIKNSTTNTLDGKAEVADQQDVTATLDGLLAIHATATALLDGSATLKSIDTDALDGKALVSSQAASLLDGAALIKDSATDMLDGQAQVKSTTTNLLDGIARIGAYSTGTLDGTVVIKDATGSLIDGLIIIKGIATDALDGITQVSESATGNLDGLMVIRQAVTIALDGKATIKDIAEQMLDGRALVQSGFTDVLDGAASIKSAAVSLVDAKVKLYTHDIVVLDGTAFVTNWQKTELLDGLFTITRLSQRFASMTFTPRTASAAFVLASPSITFTIKKPSITFTKG
jgi:hypothetical protein